MKRTTISSLVGVLIIGVLLSVPGFSLTSASGATPSPPQVALQSTASPDVVRLGTALLVPPNQCISPCLWEFQPGTQTLADFKQLALAAFGSAVQDYAAPDRVLTGFYSSGVALHTSPIANPTLSSVVDYLYVRVDPSQARAAGVSFDTVSPVSILKAFGKPSDAFLLFDKKLRRYTLLLYYPTQSLVYVVRSAFDNSKACLNLTNVETLTLYRFKDAPATQQFVKDATGPGNVMPLSISTTTKQTLNDLVQGQTMPCLIPK